MYSLVFDDAPRALPSPSLSFLGAKKNINDDDDDTQLSMDTFDTLFELMTSEALQGALDVSSSSGSSLSPVSLLDGPPGRAAADADDNNARAAYLASGCVGAKPVRSPEALRLVVDLLGHCERKPDLQARVMEALVDALDGSSAGIQVRRCVCWWIVCMLNWRRSCSRATRDGASLAVHTRSRGFARCSSMADLARCTAVVGERRSNAHWVIRERKRWSPEYFLHQELCCSKTRPPRSAQRLPVFALPPPSLLPHTPVFAVSPSCLLWPCLVAQTCILQVWRRAFHESGAFAPLLYLLSPPAFATAEAGPASASASSMPRPTGDTAPGNASGGGGRPVYRRSASFSLSSSGPAGTIAGVTREDGGGGGSGGARASTATTRVSTGERPAVAAGVVARTQAARMVQVLVAGSAAVVPAVRPQVGGD